MLYWAGLLKGTDKEVFQGNVRAMMNGTPLLARQMAPKLWNLAHVVLLMVDCPFSSWCLVQRITLLKSS